MLCGRPCWMSHIAYITAVGLRQLTSNTHSCEDMRIFGLLFYVLDVVRQALLDVSCGFSIPILVNFLQRTLLHITQLIMITHSVSNCYIYAIHLSLSQSCTLIAMSSCHFITQYTFTCTFNTLTHSPDITVEASQLICAVLIHVLLTYDYLLTSSWLP